VDPSKVSDVLKWEAPRTVSEIKSFFGLAGYYRRFIEGFSKIVKPLTTLLEKDREFKWTDACMPVVFIHCPYSNPHHLKWGGYG
jgi:hypothetical protein